MALAFLQGCASVSYPTNKDIGIGQPVDADRYASDITNAAEARRYISTALQSMQSLSNRLQAEEVAGDLGVAAAGITLVSAAGLRGSHDLIAGSAIAAGSAYALTSAFNPRGQEAVLGEGIAALHCVESAAEPGLKAAGAADIVLQPVLSDLRALQTALRAAPSSTMLSGSDKKVYNDGVLHFGQGWAFFEANKPIIFQNIHDVTDKIIGAINSLMSKDRADPIAFEKMILGIGATATSNVNTISREISPVTNSTVDAAIAAREPHTSSTGTKGQANIAIDNIGAATVNLTNDIHAAKEVFGPNGINMTPISFTECVPGSTVLRVMPSTKNIKLNKGDNYDITVTGGQFNWSWVGPDPTPKYIGVTQISSTRLVLHGVLSTKKSYTLEFVPLATGGANYVNVSVK